MKKPDLNKLLPYLACIVIMAMLAIIYFYPQLQGKSLTLGDIQQWEGMSKEVRDYRDQTGINSLWTGSMFSGMPTYQLTSPSTGNLVRNTNKILSLMFSKPIGFFIMGMICYFIALISLGINKWLSVVGAVSFAFATGYMGLFDAGHTSKIVAVFTAPPIIAGIILIFKNKFLLGGVLFSFFLALSLGANHPQMTYYLAIMLSVMVLLFVINQVKNKAYKDLGIQVGILLLGSIIALGTSASKVLPTLEYTQSTMRGAPILEKEASAPTTSSNTDGLDWNYAMNWSNNGLDLLSSFIPYAVGASSAEIMDDDSKIIRQYPALRGQPLPLYWGGLPSTSMPYYFGALLFLLFIFGAIVVRGPLKWGILSGVLITMLISLGNNFEEFNRLLFDLLPMYNKFRTPNSVLTVTNLFIPLLAILGLHELISAKDKKQYTKPLYYAFGALGGICLVLALMGSSLFSFESKVDGQIGQLGQILQDVRGEFLSSSAWRSLFIMAAGMGLLYFYIQGKLKEVFLVAAVGFITVIDLWSIDKNYIAADDFVPKRRVEVPFSPRPVDQQILQDSDPHYRVYDLTKDIRNNASSSYFHKTIGGYHPAKLQRYEDLIERYLIRNHQPVLNMLNTKYFITNSGPDNSPAVTRNPNALGNAWFVQNIQWVENANAEIAALQNFNPATTAVVHSEFKANLNSETYSGTGEISLTSYAPNKLTYKSSSSADQLAVFSEVWYTPGWKITIDGNPAEMIRANYILRALPVPAGQHEIVFEFNPDTFKKGVMISYISSILLILGIIALIVYQFYWKPR